MQNQVTLLASLLRLDVLAILIAVQLQVAKKQDPVLWRASLNGLVVWLASMQLILMVLLENGAETGVGQSKIFSDRTLGTIETGETVDIYQPTMHQAEEWIN